MRVPHEDRMKIEKSFNSNQGAAKERQQLQEHKKDKTQKTASSWNDITLTLLANNRIECSFEGGSLRKSLEEIGLAKKGNQKLAKPGLVLLGFPHQVKYPVAEHPTQAEKRNISRIRDALRKLCGLTGDPFHPINSSYGYKLKCKLIDNTKLSDLRAKERAIEVSYDGNKHNFARDDDDAQRFMDDPANYDPSVDD